MKLAAEHKRRKARYVLVFNDSAFPNFDSGVLSGDKGRSVSAERMGQVQEEAKKEIALMKKFFDIVSIVVALLIAGLCLFLWIFA